MSKRKGGSRYLDFEYGRTSRFYSNKKTYFDKKNQKIDKSSRIMDIVRKIWV